MKIAAFVLAAALGATPALAVRTYTLTELTVNSRDPLGRVSPVAINGSGFVAGNASTGFQQSTALLWTPAGVGRSIAPIGAVFSRANAINAAGQVVGTAEFLEEGNRVARAFVYDTATDSHVLLAGAGSFGNGINDLGQVVGAVNGQPFLFDPGSGLRTYALPSSIVEASFNGIANNGTIIGIRAAESPLGPQLSRTSFVLSGADGVIPNTPMNPTFSDTFLSSNNAGQYSVQTSVINAPFFSTFSGIYNLDNSIASNQLGILPGDETNYGGGFNDFLDIVGESYSENRNGGGFGDAIITTRDGVTIKLAPQVVNLGEYFIQQGRAINNDGIIAAFGGGKAFVLRPNDLDVTPGVPEPASWAMMIGGFGLAGAALRRRRCVGGGARALPPEERLDAEGAGAAPLLPAPDGA
jgi:probable HAF family extracellular repeat protein